MPDLLQLKPCPFCGHAIVRILPQPDWTGSKSINCESCLATVTVVALFEEQAITAWNQRVDPPTIVQAKDEEKRRIMAGLAVRDADLLLCLHLLQEKLDKMPTQIAKTIRKWREELIRSGIDQRTLEHWKDAYENIAIRIGREDHVSKDPNDH